MGPGRATAADERDQASGRVDSDSSHLVIGTAEVARDNPARSERAIKRTARSELGDKAVLIAAGVLYSAGDQNAAARQGRDASAPCSQPVDERLNTGCGTKVHVRRTVGVDPVQRQAVQLVTANSETGDQNFAISLDGDGRALVLLITEADELARGAVKGGVVTASRQQPTAFQRLGDGPGKHSGTDAGRIAQGHALSPVVNGPLRGQNLVG